MEITWEVGLKETAEEMVKRKKSEKEQKELTPWENYLNERKQKKKVKQQAKQRKDQDRFVKFPIRKICLRGVLPHRLQGHTWGDMIPPTPTLALQPIIFPPVVKVPEHINPHSPRSSNSHCPQYLSEVLCP